MNRIVYKTGYFAGIAAFGFTVAYCVVQLMQVVQITHFPIDEILIYSTSLGIVIPFILEMLAFHYVTPLEKKFWTHAAIIFAIMYAVFVTANYVVQLTTVIPMKLRGEAEKVRILDQTPHSLFWDFDALGYFFMGLSTLAGIPALAKRGFQKWVRLSFIANALVTPLIMFVYFYPNYSEKILALGYPWAITAPLSMLMLALMFRREINAGY
ncbi:MAG: hypothetical protein C5B52_01600 [Bacteroidetes bacterium]|nr:MAG: hypothetical protein C5B52_01600 [Bacteroidota bacterium]